LAKIRAMQAQIKADTASLAGDKATLGYAKIFAPIEGTIVSISVREGQTLNANQNAPLLLKIADLSILTLRAKVSEADVNLLSKDMPVYFKTFGGGDRRWYSKVRQVLPTPSIINDVVLYQALIDIDNNDGQLMDAMTTQVFFVRDSAVNTLIVPLGAIRTTNTSNKNVGEIIRKNGVRLETISVKTGVRNRTHAEVLSGLNENDTVVIGDQDRNANKANSLLGSQRRGF